MHLMKMKLVAALIGNQTSTRERARLESLYLPRSGAWLAAPPIPTLGLHFLANVSVRYRLGIAVDDRERECSFCRSCILYTFIDRAVHCHGCGNAISRRNRNRNRIVSACSANNLSPVNEKRNPLAENNSRPGEIYQPS